MSDQFYVTYPRWDIGSPYGMERDGVYEIFLKSYILHVSRVSFSHKKTVYNHT